MQDFFLTAVYGYFPYVALTVFFVGCLIRFEREQYTWRTGSSQLLRRRFMLVGSNLFHIGVLGLLLTHLFGLLMPVEVYHVFGITKPMKQWMAIIVGSLLGIAAIVGAGMLLYRRLADPRIRKNSAPMDIGILVLLFLNLLTGLFTVPVALGHTDGHMMAQMMAWAQKIWTFRAGAAEHLTHVHPVYLLHIFLGLLTFLIFPFTRLVHVWSIPLAYFRRPYQVVRSRKIPRGQRR